MTTKMTGKKDAKKVPTAGIPLWVYVAFIATSLIAISSVGISQYQQYQAQETNQEQRAEVEELQQALLTQDDVININWLHTLNPLVKDVKGSIIWSSNKQHGIITIYNLPSLEKTQKYHLWIYDLNANDRTPISALVFNTENDSLTTSFSPEKYVTSPFKFEILLEEEGATESLSLLLAQP